MDQDINLKNAADLNPLIADCDAKLQQEIENRNSLQIRLATSNDRSVIRSVTQQLDFSNRKVELISMDLIKHLKRQLSLKDKFLESMDSQTTLPKLLAPKTIPTTTGSTSEAYQLVEKKLDATELLLKKMNETNTLLTEKNGELELELKLLRAQIDRQSKIKEEPKSSSMPDAVEVSTDIRRPSIQSSPKIGALIPDLQFLTGAPLMNTKVIEKETSSISSTNQSITTTTTSTSSSSSAPPPSKFNKIENRVPELIKKVHSILAPSAPQTSKPPHLKNALQSQCLICLDQIQKMVIVWIQSLIHLKQDPTALPNMDLDNPLSILMSILLLILSELFPTFKGRAPNDCHEYICELFKEQAKYDPLSFRAPQEEAKEIISLKQQFMKLKQDHEALQYENEKHQELVKSYQSKYEPVQEKAAPPMMASTQTDALPMEEDAKAKEQSTELQAKLQSLEAELNTKATSLLELEKEVRKRDKAVLQLEEDLNESKERFHVLMKFTEDQKTEFRNLLDMFKEEMEKLAEDNEILQERLAEYEDMVHERGSEGSGSPQMEEYSPVNRTVAGNSPTSTDSPLPISELDNVSTQELTQQLQRELEDKEAFISALDKRLKKTESELRKKERRIRYLEKCLKQNGIEFITNLDTSSFTSGDTESGSVSPIDANTSSHRDPSKAMWESMEKELLQMEAQSEWSNVESISDPSSTEARNVMNETSSSSPKPETTEDLNRILKNKRKIIEETKRNISFRLKTLTLINDDLNDFQMKLEALDQEIYAQAHGFNLNLRNTTMNIPSPSLSYIPSSSPTSLDVPALPSSRSLANSAYPSTPQSSAIRSASAKEAIDDLLLQLQVESQGENLELPPSSTTSEETELEFLPDSETKMQEFSLLQKQLQEKTELVEVAQSHAQVLEEKVIKHVEEIQRLEEAVQMAGLKTMEYVEQQEGWTQEKRQFESQVQVLQQENEELSHQLEHYKQELQTLSRSPDNNPDTMVSSKDVDKSSSLLTSSAPSPQDMEKEKSSPSSMPYNAYLDEIQELREKLHLATVHQERFNDLEKVLSEKSLYCEEQEVKIQELQSQLEAQEKVLSNRELNLEDSTKTSPPTQEEGLETLKQLYHKSQMALNLATDQVHSLQSEKKELVKVMEELQLELNILQMDVEAIQLQKALPEVTAQRSVIEKRESWLAALNSVQGEDSDQVQHLKKELQELQTRFTYTSGLLEEAKAKGDQVITLLETIQSKDVKYADLEKELVLVKQAHSKSLREKGEELNLSRQGNQDMLLRMQTVQEEKQSLETKLETILKELASSQTEVTAYQALKNEYEELKETLELKITEHQDRYQSLSVELESTKEAYQSLEMELEKNRHELEAITEKSRMNDELIEKTTQMELDFQALTTEKMSFMDRLNQMEEELKHKVTRIEELELMLNEANVTIQGLEKETLEMEDLRDELVDVKTQYHETLSQMDELQSRSLKMDTEREELSNQLEVTLLFQQNLQHEFDTVNEFLKTTLQEETLFAEDTSTLVELSTIDKLNKLKNRHQELRNELVKAQETQFQNERELEQLGFQLKEASLAKVHLETELLAIRERLHKLMVEKETMISIEIPSGLHHDMNEDEMERISTRSFSSLEHSSSSTSSSSLSSPSRHGDRNTSLTVPAFHSETPREQDPSRHYLSPKEDMEGRPMVGDPGELIAQDQEYSAHRILHLQKEIEHLRSRLAATVDYEYKHSLVCQYVAHYSQMKNWNGSFPSPPTKASFPSFSSPPTYGASKDATTWTSPISPFSTESVTEVTSTPRSIQLPSSKDEEEMERLKRKQDDLQKATQFVYDSCQSTLNLIRGQLEQLESTSQQVEKNEVQLERMVAQFLGLKSKLEQNPSFRLTPVDLNTEETTKEVTSVEDEVETEHPAKPKSIDTHLTHLSIDSDADTESLPDELVSSSPNKTMLESELMEPTTTTTLSKLPNRQKSPLALNGSIESKSFDYADASTSPLSQSDTLMTTFSQFEVRNEEYIEVVDYLQTKLRSSSFSSSSPMSNPESEPLSAKDNIRLNDLVYRFELVLQKQREEEQLAIATANEKTISLLSSDFEEQEKKLLSQLQKQKNLVQQLQKEKSTLTMKLEELEEMNQKLQELLDLCKEEAEEREEELSKRIAAFKVEHETFKKEKRELEIRIEELKLELEDLKVNLNQFHELDKNQELSPWKGKETDQDTKLKELNQELQDKLRIYEERMNDMMQKNMELVMQLSQFQ